MEPHGMFLEWTLTALIYGEMTLSPIQYTACFGPKFNSLYARPRAFRFIVNDIMTQLKLHIGMHVQCH